MKTSESLQEYTFDCTLVAAVRVYATDQDKAEAMINDALDSASCNAGAWPNGDPILFEASLALPPYLFEIQE